MSVTVAVLESRLIANTRDHDRALDQSDSKMKSLAKTAGKAGLAGAVIGLGVAVKVGFDEFIEAQKVAAQTDAVLKSTGGAANVTAKEIDNLSSSLLRKSGVDDEVIRGGANMLLTFTKIRNEVGAGNDIFNQATTATLNLSVAMGKDMQSSAILVGKALNDPIKGMSALSRAGIQFTEEQKETIKTMVEAGNTMGAQKLILGELETQFGGSAEAAGKTFGGQINIAKETLRNLAGQGVAFLMPHLIEFTGWIRDTAVPFIRNFVNGMRGSEGMQGGFSVVATFVRDVFIPIIKGVVGVFAEAFAAVNRVLNNHKEEVRTIVAGVKALLEGIGLVFTEVIIPTLRFVFKEGGPFDLAFGLAIKIVAGLIRGINDIADAVRATVAAIQKFWNGKGGDVIREVFDGFAAAIRPVLAMFEGIIDSVKWLIDNLGKLGGLIGKIPGVGDPRDPGMGFPLPTPGPHPGGIDLMGASPVLLPAAQAAAAFGLRVTSGLRPGAITANGTLSDHAIGKAIDVSNGVNTPQMAAFFNWLVGKSWVKQAFYDPRGSIFGGKWSSYREGGHSDHVHVATYAKGGVVPGFGPRLAIVHGGETITPRGGGNVTVNVYGSVTSENDLIEAIRRGLERTGRRNVDIFGGLTG